MGKRIECLVESGTSRLEFAYECDNAGLLHEVSTSKHCVDTFEENGEFVLVQLWFGTMVEFKDWFNTTF